MPLPLGTVFIPLQLQIAIHCGGAGRCTCPSQTHSSWMVLCTMHLSVAYTFYPSSSIFCGTTASKPPNFQSFRGTIFWKQIHLSFLPQLSLFLFLSLNWWHSGKPCSNRVVHSNLDHRRGVWMFFMCLYGFPFTFQRHAGSCLICLCTCYHVLYASPKLMPVDWLSLAFRLCTQRCSFFWCLKVASYR